METVELGIEEREIGAFDQVTLRDDSCGAELVIEQGEREGIRIEARPQLLRRIETQVRDGRLIIRMSGSWLERLGDKLSTSLTRSRTLYHLQARELRSLDIGCAAMVFAPSLRADTLAIKLAGATRVVIENLVARELRIEHSGVGELEVDGRVVRQEVTLDGVGMYSAAELRSQVSVVRISGPARARVHASEELDAVVRGIGVVEYSGSPRVRQRVLGMGSVVKVE